MADFEKTRDSLIIGRNRIEEAKHDLNVSGHRLRLLEQELRNLERQRDDNSESYIRRKQRLERQIAGEKAAQTKHQERYKGIRSELLGLEKDFQLFVDPRKELGAHFSNEIPFLLFPLRMETRFKTVKNKAQLWVRAYPDECLIDSFEPLLSTKEVNNATRFWAEYYGAGTSSDPENPDPGVLNLQKASWALLVSASSGAGRASWITRQLRPDTAKSVFPLREDNMVILAIATDNWDPVWQPAIFDLFIKLWYADGNDELIRQIKQEFNINNPTLDADKIIESYRPVNFDDKLPIEIRKKEDAVLKIAVAVFNDLDKVSGKEHAWSQPSRANLLPERLALIRYKNGIAMEPVFGNSIPYPLYTSPNPSSEAEKQFTQTPQGDLEFAEEIKWVADFDKAVEIGMGFRLDLATDEVNGFERMLVLGVSLGSDAENGKNKLEELFNHHYFSKKGFTLLPQGTPTNNTGTADSGYTSSEDPDKTFDLYFKQKDAFNEEADADKKRDGQWIAEWLGLDYSAFKKVMHSDKLDQADSRNMNTALWPATIGYVLESLMEGGFSGETLLHARNFFNNFVSGRGPVPAIRIGNQPYGILTAAAFSRLQWMNTTSAGGIFTTVNRSNLAFLRNLYQLLLKMDVYWKNNMLSGVPFVAKTAVDPYQDLLDIIGLHPNSVEFHRRYLESLIEMKNKVSIIKPGYQLNQQVVIDAINLLHSTLGYATDILPQVAALLAMPWQVPVNQLIDDQPLSEVNDIRDYTADHKNYIEALISQAQKGENSIRTGEGLSERPATELYKLLKYALELGYHKSAVDAVEEKHVFDPEKIAAMRTEQAFTHQLLNEKVSESRYAILYDTIPDISPNRTVGEFIRDSLFEAEIPFFSKYLSSQINALENLKYASTARLERALVEHLDSCSYRLDAWKTAIIANGLSTLRNNHPGTHWDRRRKGVYLGAFGWLENVRPEKDKVLTPKEIPEDLKEDFNPDGNKTFFTDAANEGYIHAPSLNQGVTAAVLRNGYVSHGKPDATSELAVNLSSERIRLALSIIEGIQGGQSLAALLGYHFERTLHNRSDLTAKKIDSYIYAIRKEFPLNADQIKDTKLANTDDPSVDPETVPITAIEARNVVHGLNLANHLKKQTIPANKIYPFGLVLPEADSAVSTAITQTVEQLIDISDAVADLGMAESVHHIVMGNVDRAAGVLESYTKGNYPQEPDVIRTPRSGATLTHRVSVPFQFVSLNPGGGPRAQTEPSVNKWLSSMLPSMSSIVCQCSYISKASGTEKKAEVSLQDLGLEPIDVIYVLNALDSGSLNELDDRLIFQLQLDGDVVIDKDIVVSYIDEPSDPAKFSVFQLMPLVKSLRALITESVHLKPGDIVLPDEAGKNELPPPELPAKRIQDLIGKLKSELANSTSPGGIVSDLLNLPVLETITEMEKETIRQNADDIMNRFAAFMILLGNYGIQQTGIGSIYSTQRQWYEAIKKKVSELIDSWQKKSDEYDLLATIPSPTEEQLLGMERLISSSTTAGVTLTIVQGKKVLFDAERAKLNTIINTRFNTVFALIQSVRLVNTVPFDMSLLDITNELNQIPLFIYDIQVRANSLMDDLEKKKIPAMEAILAGLPALSLDEQAKQIESAAKIILGDQFKMFPRYPMPADLQTEISNSWNDTDKLLDYLRTADKRLDPLEDWLHGIARVHEKMKHLENCIILREAFDLDLDKLSIHPVQLPYKTEKYHWMAMSFPQGDVDLEEGNTLLYTAFTDAVAAAPIEVCGILADEWVEVIPAAEETTGITFHYDRPNCEAPQTLLLVTPAQFSGNWDWNDLRDALNHTLEAAKSRAIAPEQIEKTPFTTFLPAVIGAESLYPYSIVLDGKVHYLASEAVSNFDQPISFD